MATTEDTPVDAYRSLEVFDSKAESWPDFYFKFRIYLQAKKLCYIIDDPSKASSATKRQEDDYKVQALLVNKVSSEALGLIKGCTTAKEMVETLREQYNATSTASVLNHLDRLLDMRYDGNSSTYISAVNRLVKQIEDAGGIDLKRLHIIVLLRGMPKTPEWLSVINPLKNEKEELTKDRVTRIITETENSLQRRSGVSTESPRKEKPGAFHTSNQYKKRYDKTYPPCKNCGKMGHSIKTCFAPGGGAEKKKTSNRVRDNSSAKDANFSYTAEDIVSQCDHSMRSYFLKDSGAAKHYVNDRKFLHNFSKTDSSLIVANGDQVKIQGQGSLKVVCYTEKGERTNVTLTDVFYVPSLVTNLISTSELDRKGLKEVSKNGISRFYDNNREVMSAVNIHGKWIMDWDAIPADGAMLTLGNDIWHKRLCHLSDDNMRKLENMVNGFKYSGHSQEKCDVCVRANMTRKTFRSTGNPRARRSMDLLHLDLEIINVEGVNGETLALIITDDCSNCRFSFPLANKDGETLLSTFMSWLPWAERMSGQKLKCIRSDNERSIMKGAFRNAMDVMGVEMQPTIKYEHEQNGKAERSNRLLLEKSRSILIESGLEKKYWPYALMTATYAANRSPTSINNQKTPIEIFTQIKPDIRNLRVFGSKCWSRVPSEKLKGHHKLDERGIPCIFLTYDKGGHAYKVMNVATGEIFSAVNVRFDETQLGLGKTTVNNQSVSVDFDDTFSDVSDITSEENFSVEIPVERATTPTPDMKSISTQPPKLKYKSKPTPTTGESPSLRRSIQRSGGDEHFDVLNLVHFAALTYNEVKRNEEEYPFYKEAMDKEMQNMKDYEVWEYVDKVPPGKNIIGCKWVLTRKTNPDGTLGKYKARLVAKGYSQVEGIDFFETFAPTVKAATLRVMLVIANHKKMKLHHFDVRAAYLNGTIEEELYMEQPQGYEIFNKERKKLHLRLKKAIYGTKQAARMWRLTLLKFLLQAGFKECIFDKCIFFKGNFVDNSVIVVILWVDDILTIYFNEDDLVKFRDDLSRMFKIEDLGEAQRYVGINISRNVDARVLVLSQNVAISGMLKHFGMSEVNGRETPLDIGQAIDPEPEGEITDKPYRSLIGCLNYPVQWTRPDLAYAVGKLSQVLSHATDEHWKLAVRVLRYVSKTANYGLIFKGGNDLDIKVLADSDWASEKNSALSTFGYIIYVGGNPVSWKSKKSRTVKTSTTTAELEGLYHGVLEALWLSDLLKLFSLRNDSPIQCFQDNKAVVKILNGECDVERTKHEIVKVEYLREKVRQGKITVSWISTEDMTADIFTKVLGRNKHQKHCGNLNLIDINMNGILNEGECCSLV